MDLFRTLIVTSATASLIRDIAAAFGPSCAGMWQTPLSPTGSGTPTHFITSGYIPSVFISLVPCQTYQCSIEGNWLLINSDPGDSVTLQEIVSNAGVTCTKAEIDAIFATADITEQEPFMAMKRMGLAIINPPMEF